MDYYSLKHRIYQESGDQVLKINFTKRNRGVSIDKSIEIAENISRGLSNIFGKLQVTRPNKQKWALVFGISMRVAGNTSTQLIFRV